MIDQYLSEVRERVERASPGPWERRKMAVISDEYYIADMQRGPDYMAHADGDFIAHARQDLPRLLRIVERCREVLASLAEKKCGCIYCERPCDEVAKEALSYTGEE